MPSVLLDDNNVVVAAMSFDPVEEKAVFTSEYRPEWVGHYFIDGVLIENEHLSNGGDVDLDGRGGVVDESE